jgi:hypothetical protein
MGAAEPPAPLFHGSVEGSCKACCGGCDGCEANPPPPIPCIPCICIPCCCCAGGAPDMCAMGPIMPPRMPPGG